jgi:hypothetical protein
VIALSISILLQCFVLFSQAEITLIPLRRYPAIRDRSANSTIRFVPVRAITKLAIGNEWSNFTKVTIKLAGFQVKNGQTTDAWCIGHVSTHI